MQVFFQPGKPRYQYDAGNSGLASSKWFTVVQNSQSATFAANNDENHGHSRVIETAVCDWNENTTTHFDPKLAWKSAASADSDLARTIAYAKGTPEWRSIVVLPRLATDKWKLQATFTWNISNVEKRSYKCEFAVGSNSDGFTLDSSNKHVFSVPSLLEGDGEYKAALICTSAQDQWQAILLEGQKGPVSGLDTFEIGFDFRKN